MHHYANDAASVSKFLQTLANFSTLLRHTFLFYRSIYSCLILPVRTALGLLSTQEAFEKCWAHSLLRAVLHCHSPGVATAAMSHAAASMSTTTTTTTTTTTGDRGDRYGPIEWAQLCHI